MIVLSIMQRLFVWSQWTYSPYVLVEVRQLMRSASTSQFFDTYLIYILHVEHAMMYLSVGHTLMY